MSTETRPTPDITDDLAANVIATPEGDNELLPDQPLQPSSDAAVSGLETPRGSEPDAYKEDPAPHPPD